MNLVIGVDDNGSPTIKSFSKTAVDGMNKFANASDKAGKKTKTAFDKIKSAVSNLKGPMAALSGLLGGIGFAAVVKEAVNFETAFAGVKKTVTASTEQLESLREGILRMASEMPATAVEISRVAEAAGQLGIKTENIESFTETMIKLGGATNLASDVAATALARLANITGLPQTEFDRLGSTIVELGNNMATTESEIVSMGLRLAGAGAQIGLAESEILAFAGALSSVGVEAEAGGTAFSKVMKDISVAVATGSDSLQKFADVATGGDLDAFVEMFETDAAGAINAFVSGLGEMRKANVNIVPTLNDLGFAGERVQDTLLRASGAGDLMTKALGLANKAFAENTALNTEAAAKMDTVAAQFQVFINNLFTAGTALTDGLLPPLKEGLKDLTAFIQASKESGVLADVIGPVGAALGAALKGGIKGAVALAKNLDNVAIAVIAIGTAVKASAIEGALLKAVPAAAALAKGLRAVAAAGALGTTGDFLREIPNQMKLATKGTTLFTVASKALGTAWKAVSAAMLASAGPVAIVAGLVAAGFAVKKMVELSADLVDELGSTDLAIQELASGFQFFGANASASANGVQEALDAQVAWNTETAKSQEIFRKVSTEMGISVGQLREMAPTMVDLIKLSKENVVVQEALASTTEKTVAARQEQAAAETALAAATVASIQNRIQQLDEAGLSTADLTTAINDQIKALQGTVAANNASANSDAGLNAGLLQSIALLKKRGSALQRSASDTTSFGDAVDALAKSVQKDTFAGMNAELKITNATIKRLVAESEGGSVAVANLRDRVAELTSTTTPASAAIKALGESVKGGTFKGMQEELAAVQGQMALMKGTVEENSPAFKQLAASAAELTAKATPAGAAMHAMAESVKGLTFEALNTELTTTEALLASMKGTVEEGSPAFIALEARLQATKEKLAPVGEAVKKLVDDANHIGPTFKAMREELVAVNVKLAELATQGPGAAAAIKALEDRARELRGGLKEAGSGVEEIIASFEKLKTANIEASLIKNKQALVDMAEGGLHSQAAIEALKKTIADLEAQLHPTATAVQAVQDRITGTGPAAEKLAKELGIAQTALKNMEDSGQGTAEQIANLKAEIAEMQTKLGPAAGSAGQFATSMGILQISSEGTAGSLFKIGSAISGLPGPLGVMGKLSENAGKAMTILGDETASLSDKLHALGPIANETAQSLGLSAEKGAALEGAFSIAKQAGGAYAAFLKGDLKGAITGAVAAFGSLKGILGGLFGGDDTSAITGAIEDITGGLEVSAELTDRITASFEETGDAATAVALNIGDIQREIGGAAENMGGFATSMATLMNGINDGTIDAAKGMEALNDGAQEFIGSAVEMDNTWTPAFGKFIADAKASGLEIAAVTEFIAEAMGKAADGMNKVWENATDLTAERFEALGELSAAVFAGLSSGPGGFLAAVEKMGPSIDAMIAKQQELGVASSEATEKMMRIRNVVEANKELFESLDGLTEVAKGLGEAGFFTAGAWDAIQTEAVNSFNAINAAGLTLNETHEATAPLLQEIYNEHLRTGKEIDSQTAELIQQGLELGTISEHGTGLELTMLRVGDAITNAIGTAFGITIPTMLGVSANAAESAAGRMGTAFSTQTQATEDVMREKFGEGGAIPGVFDTVMAKGDEAALGITEAWVGTADAVSESMSRLSGESVEASDAIANSFDETADSIAVSFNEAANAAGAGIGEIENAVGVGLNSMSASVSSAMNKVAADERSFFQASAGAASGFLEGISGKLARLKAIRGDIGNFNVPNFHEGGFVAATIGMAHKGEFVLSAAAVNRIGVDNLEAMNEGDASQTAAPTGAGAGPSEVEFDGGSSSGPPSFVIHATIGGEAIDARITSVTQRGLNNREIRPIESGILES